jgi:site-specific DNA recombinase
VPVIVDKDLFDRVQERLDLNMKFSHRNNKRSDYLLTGLLVCTCGQSRTGDPGANGNLYYRCTNRLHRFPMKRTCFEGGVSATILDALVWQNLQALLSDPERIEAHASAWLETQHKAAEATKATDLDQLSEKLIAEEQRYAKAYGSGFMSEEVFNERMRDVLQRRKALTKKRQKAEATKLASVTISPKELAAKTSSLLKDLDFTDKKDIIRRVIQKIEVDQKEATVWGLIPLLSDGKVGLNAKHWHRWLAQRR